MQATKFYLGRVLQKQRERKNNLHLDVYPVYNFGSFGFKNLCQYLTLVIEASILFKLLKP
jgi:hypothetical protein